MYLQFQQCRKFQNSRPIEVESVKGSGRGRPRKTWRECVEEDMSKL